MTIVANKYDKGYISKFNPFVAELNDLYLYPLEAVIVIHHFKLVKMTLERILGGTSWIYMYLQQAVLKGEIGVFTLFMNL